MALVRWAAENGCPWHERACSTLALLGQWEVLRLVREGWLSMELGHVFGHRRVREPCGGQVGSRERLSVGREDARPSGHGGAPYGFSMGTGKLLPLEREDVLRG